MDTEYVVMEDVNLQSDQEGFKIILKESPQAKRYFIMLVGQGEYSAIAKEKGIVDIPRPLTHEVYLMLLETLGILFSRVEIQDLRANTYYANIFFNKDGQEMSLDARPSDAVTLALNRKIPILVNRRLLKWEANYSEEIEILKEFIKIVKF